MRRGLMLGCVGLMLVGCAVPQKMLVSAKPIPEQKRDQVECQALAVQGAGQGYGWLYQVRVRELYELCLEGRSWVVP